MQAGFVFGKVTVHTVLRGRNPENQIPSPLPSQYRNPSTQLVNTP